LPADKELRAFLTWAWLREGWVWNKVTGERQPASEDLMVRARRGGIVKETDDDKGFLIIYSDGEDEADGSDGRGESETRDGRRCGGAGREEKSRVQMLAGEVLDDAIAAAAATAVVGSSATTSCLS